MGSRLASWGGAQTRKGGVRPEMLVIKVVRRPVRGSVRITVAPGTGVASRPE